MPNLRCIQCDNIRRFTTKEKKYLPPQSTFVCSTECAASWIESRDHFICSVPLGDYVVVNPNAAREHPAFRSMYEQQVAWWLTSRGISWVYEMYGFEVDDGGYTPDFYLFNYDCFVEVKGLWWASQKTKFAKFQKKYPRVDIIVLGWLLREEIEEEVQRWRGITSNEER